MDEVEARCMCSDKRVCPWKRFGKTIIEHVSGGNIFDCDNTGINHFTNKSVSYVDAL